MRQKKIAVVLFNLGGPDSLRSVKPFLFNLFYDKHIIRLKNPFRYIIAKLISTLRNKTAQEIYANTGGRSPILDETEKQRISLENVLNASHNANINASYSYLYKVFIAMRHWHPFSCEAIEEVRKFAPDEIILLPLYPQLSTTTSISSIEDFKENWFNASKSYSASKDCGPSDLQNRDHLPIIKTICCYPIDDKFILAHVELLADKIESLQNKENFRILFSAHGLPKKIIDDGDPYQWQVEQTVSKVIDRVKVSLRFNSSFNNTAHNDAIVKINNNLDYKITYQSRVGPVEWIKPSTEDEIRVAAREGKAIIIVPISFVSEHVETLVELDIEYKGIASEASVEYLRVPTLSLSKIFIESLSEMVMKFTIGNFPGGCNKQGYDRSVDIVLSSSEQRICPDNFKGCPSRLE